MIVVATATITDTTTATATVQANTIVDPTTVRHARRRRMKGCNDGCRRRTRTASSSSPPPLIVRAVIVEAVLDAMIFITITPPVLLPPPITHQHQPLLIVVFLLTTSHRIEIPPPLDDCDLSSPFLVVPPHPYPLSPNACSFFLSLLRHPPAFVVAFRQAIIDSRCLQKLQSDVRRRKAMKYIPCKITSQESHLVGAIF